MKYATVFGERRASQTLKAGVARVSRQRTRILTVMGRQIAKQSSNPLDGAWFGAGSVGSFAFFSFTEDANMANENYFIYVFKKLIY